MYKLAVPLFLVLFLVPSLLCADVIYLKNGSVIHSPKVWVEGTQIKCYRFGGVVGYPKDSVERIVKEPRTQDDQDAHPLDPPHNPTQDSNQRGSIDRIF